VNHLSKQAHYDSTPAAENGVWRGLLDGDKTSLARIYTAYFDKLYNYGVRISSDSLVVEDAIQDLFIELWNRRERLNPEVRNVKQYLYICLRRKILLKLQSRHASISIDDLPSFRLELSHKSHYLTHQLNKELRQKLAEMIQTLTPKQKEAIFLIYFDELSYEQVASIMGLKIKTIYNLVHQAIAKLKDHRNDFWQMIPMLF
jgi:RNA polymerase sigma factor (sigma-70 family)